MILSRDPHPASSLRFVQIFAKLIMPSAIIVRLSVCYYSLVRVTIRASVYQTTALRIDHAGKANRPKFLLCQSFVTLSAVVPCPGRPTLRLEGLVHQSHP